MLNLRLISAAGSYPTSLKDVRSFKMAFKEFEASKKRSSTLSSRQLSSLSILSVSVDNGSEHDCLYR